MLSTAAALIVFLASPPDEARRVGIAAIIGGAK